MIDMLILDCYSCYGAMETTLNTMKGGAYGRSPQERASDRGIPLSAVYCINLVVQNSYCFGKEAFPLLFRE